jgi:hypothetical protein
MKGLGRSLNVYHLVAGKTLWSPRKEALVAAETKKQAIACMSKGDDALWASVKECHRIGNLKVEETFFMGSCYENSGGYVIL